MTMALCSGQEPTPVILHSDRGWQFTSDEHEPSLKGHNLT